MIINDVVSIEVEPIPTYVDFGDNEFLVADKRGYEHLVYELAKSFLSTSDAQIMDTRLKLNNVHKNHLIDYSVKYYMINSLLIKKFY